jgi:hypothetical protein
MNNTLLARLSRWTKSTGFRVTVTIGILVFGLVDLPISWGKGRMMKHAMKSPEQGRESAGYYEGLIGTSDPAAGALEQSLVGQPTDWVHFADSGVSQLVTNDVLQFILSPNVSRSLFGKEFTTNQFRMRDRPVTEDKPAGTVRVALLGASMDMGWGVATDETYENRLEDWLNQQSRARGDSRRFEVLNFAVAAYSPTQRLTVYRRLVRKFKPDMVFYATTLLDPRLTEIHLCDSLNNRADISGYPYLTSVVAEAGYDPANLRRDPRGKWQDKGKFKTWLEPKREGINRTVMQELARECRADGIKLACLIIPRAGRNDLKHLRQQGVTEQVESCRAAGVPVWDLTDSFDQEDPTRLAVAVWDDHPNTRGHELIYRDLARHLLADPLRAEFGLSGQESPPGDEPGR